MTRRNFMKASLVLAGSTLLGLTGCEEDPVEEVKRFNNGSSTNKVTDDEIKSNERIYCISSLNRDVCKEKLQKFLDTNGVLTAKDVSRIGSSIGGIYNPKVEDLEAYGWTDISEAFCGKYGGMYYLQLPLIQKLN